MSLGAYSDEDLAAGYVKAEAAGDYDLADQYQDEFFRRRASRFTNQYDGEDTLGQWMKLCESAVQSNTGNTS